MTVGFDLPFKGGTVKTVDGQVPTPGFRIPDTYTGPGPRPLKPLTQAQQPSPPEGIPQFCTVCGHRFYSEVPRRVCTMACFRRLP